ncbi:DUF2797 domain-containing protein [Streptomyces sp. NPDC004065]|uniref:DUF2797 domain-containing protein n=1 Tax=Streptomyces sp. NPDC004065 TaxID=3364689 RepID=UPI00384CBFCA
MAAEWECAGLRWDRGGPVLVWRGGAVSPLRWGKRVAFQVVEGGVRTCVGARGNACPGRAAVPGRSTGARCEECARLDRAHSVAADTIADDPRPYHVYLAWFGPGMVKVGITAVERGPARLLEQGAVCFSLLGAGPLMAARRTEQLLRSALGVPDRIPYSAKRAVRSGLPASAAERTAEIADVHARAGALGGLPESLERLPFRPVDHAQVFGLEGLPAAVGEVSELVAGGVVSGELVAAAGPDLHLASGPDPHLAAGDGGAGAGADGVVVLDTRLLAGWRLRPTASGGLTVPVRELCGARTGVAGAGVQDGLF